MVEQHVGIATRPVSSACPVPWATMRADCEAAADELGARVTCRASKEALRRRTLDDATADEQ